MLVSVASVTIKVVISGPKAASTFKTSFISHPKSQLKQQDTHTCVCRVKRCPHRIQLDPQPESQGHG